MVMSELAVPVRAVRSPPLWTGNALRPHEGRLAAPLVWKNVRTLLMAFHDWNTLKILVNRRKRCMFFYEFELLQQNASTSHPALPWSLVFLLLLRGPLIFTVTLPGFRVTGDKRRM